jgi:serine/threonine protein phosphatase 1
MVAIIGDVHGCYYTLVDLYKKIVSSYPGIEVYSVGDMVDRGNFSCEVMDFIIENNILMTPGNHDYMFYHFFKDPQSIFAKSWFFNGSEPTLESYEDRQAAMFRHIDFIKEAPLYFNLPDCFISHAGVSNLYEKFLPKNFRDMLEMLDPYIRNDLKTDRGILWTRDPLLNLGKLQVVGHTKQQEITLIEDANSVYIDTGACVGNKLSAIIVHESQIVQTIEEKTHLNDII